MSEGARADGAVFSDCGRYRYMLQRSGWMGGKGTVLFVMLNPSTADAEQDDPTIRRCIRFAQDWGYSRLLVGNLYAYRATNPKELPRVSHEAIGETTPEARAYGSIYRNRNDDYLRTLTFSASCVVVAWGAHTGPDPARASRVADLLNTHGARLMALGQTKAGHPRHPLYVKADAALIDWPTPTEERKSNG